MPSETHDVADRRHVRLGELGRVGLGAVDRLRDDLDQRHAGAVVIDERVLGALDAAGRAADVGELAGVLLHVGALDRHLERRVPSASSTSTEPSKAIGSSYWLDLVVLRQVGVEVVLAGEAARRRRSSSPARARGRSSTRTALLVDHGQRPGQARGTPGSRGCSARRRTRSSGRRENILVLVFSSTCTSKPRTGSNSSSALSKSISSALAISGSPPRCATSSSQTRGARLEQALSPTGLDQQRLEGGPRV